MTPTGSQSIPYWIATTPATDFPPLSPGIQTDVAIVGGGIVGVTTALLLKQAGRSVALIEARQVAAQVTGGTTAKITSLHAIIYADLVRRFGDATARLYGESNQAALELIARLVAERSIDCDFERKAAYTYSESEDRLDELREEAEVAARLGLPASFVTEAPAPMRIAGAVRFENQAQFHPRKYLLALLPEIPGGGSHVFEGTRVLDVEDGEPCRISTDQGVLAAGEVILATNLPILDRGGYFATAFPRSHPVLAARIEETSAPDGMFLSIDSPSFSVRTHRDEEGLIAVITGPSYKTGQGDPEQLLRRTEAWAEKNFRLRAISNRWTNEDFDSMDRMPFIGRLSSRADHIWVATAFNAWGMTGGTLAAMILADLLQGKANAWARIYDSTRLNARKSAPKFLKENLNVAKEWLGDHLFGPPRREVENLAAGEGVVVSTEDGKVAVCRDSEGVLHAVSAVCTHMGCTLAWNGVSKTWDCPCHGSRFDLDGHVLFGPAVKNLQPRRVPAPRRKAS